MRVLADSNIVGRAVRAMRDAGHDVVYIGERARDPGDEALLAEAAADRRIFVTKDHDIGALVHRVRRPHCGVLLLDDLGDAAAETGLILSVLATQSDRLNSSAFLRVSAAGVRESRGELEQLCSLFRALRARCQPRFSMRSLAPRRPRTPRLSSVAVQASPSNTR